MNTDSIAFLAGSLTLGCMLITIICACRLELKINDILSELKKLNEREGR